MLIVQKTQAGQFFRQTKMRATLGLRFELKDKLSETMDAQAAPIEWLAMAMDPGAFTGTRLSPRMVEIYRSIILKHVATSLIADPAQPGLGSHMACAIKRPAIGGGYHAALAFENFAMVINAAELPPLADEAGRQNIMALATAVMHRTADAPPAEKITGRTLRDKLDAQLAAYVAPPLPLPLAPNITVSYKSTAPQRKP